MCVSSCSRFPLQRPNNAAEGGEAENPPETAAAHVSPPTGSNPPPPCDKLVITSQDSVQEVLEKLSGQPTSTGANDEGKSGPEKSSAGTEKSGSGGEKSASGARSVDPLDRFDSPDISKELETAFFRLDSGETEI